MLEAVRSIGKLVLGSINPRAPATPPLKTRAQYRGEGRERNVVTQSLSSGTTG
ncbi:hypothetical protein D9M68_140740 [compost metagenome]